MSKRLFAGIDTSNYTTSAALCDEAGNVLCNAKQLLPVAEGERGLRQSDAVFHHVRNLPTVVSQLRRAVADAKEKEPCEIVAIGVSAYPRDAEGSYMPCFLSGMAAAETAGAMLGVPVLPFSHQAGHVMAALHSADAMHLIGKPFAAFHVSGGTTEVLYVEPHGEHVFHVTKLGGTKDITAGQAIDRAGVYMGLRFPAGAEMERLAETYTGKVQRAKVSVSGLTCNLSGVENKARQMYDTTGDAAMTSAFVLDFVGRTLCGLRDHLRETHGDLPIVYAGGVMRCQRIRHMLAEEGAYFAQPRFSSDNAAGTALLARHTYLQSERDHVGDHA